MFSYYPKNYKPNKIFVLNDGKIVQSGTHEQLEEEEGHYMEFVKNQLINKD